MDEERRKVFVEKVRRLKRLLEQCSRGGHQYTNGSSRCDHCEQWRTVTA